jgi:Lipid A 3-O-deacylase (PagL)
MKRISYCSPNLFFLMKFEKILYLRAPYYMISCRVSLLFFNSLFFIYSLRGNAQEIKQFEGSGVEVNVFAGKVVKHTVNFHLPVPDMTTGVDVNFLWKTYGKKEWHQRRRYPTLGLGVAYTNYGIDSVYGRCFSLYPNIVVPLISGKKLEWTLRIGDGIGYVTKAYSRVHPFDTMNNAIGSKINDYASFMTDLRYHVNGHWDVQAGVNFSHISDASFHQPNLGVNLMGAHFGVRYFPVSSSPKHLVHNLKPLKNRWLFQFRLTLAFEEVSAPLGPLYPIYLGTAYVSKRWISKNKLFGGIDYSYHTNIYSYLRNNIGFVQPGTEAQHSYKGAVFLGNEFLLGKVGVVLQLGGYFHEAFQKQGRIYEKLGGNLYLVQKEKGPIKEFFLCAFLKAHLSVAELAEFGFGMGF